MFRRRSRSSGTSMVEFTLIAPLLLIVVFGLVDFGRAIQANSSIADAARQGARQAVANAASTDTPFGTPNGSSCSGSVFTQNQTGTGCLTDAAIATTVRGVLRSLTTTVNLQSNTPAASCPAPASGQATLCVAPAESGSGGPSSSYNTCALVNAAATYPFAGVGDRKTEWGSASHPLHGCFLVQVTVRYAFSPWTPLVGSVIGSNVQLVSATSVIAEY